MIIAREEGTQHAVNESRSENLVVAGLAFALGEAAGEASCCGILLAVINLQGHEIGAWYSIFSCADRCQKHGVVHSEDNRAVGLLGYFSCLNGDGSSISQLNGFRNYVHLILKKLTVVSKTSKNKSIASQNSAKVCKKYYKPASYAFFSDLLSMWKAIRFVMLCFLLTFADGYYGSITTII